MGFCEHCGTGPECAVCGRDDGADVTVGLVGWDDVSDIDPRILEAARQAVQALPIW